eukprot:1207484-Pyramimonas_sp.AAC.1
MRTQFCQLHVVGGAKPTARKHLDNTNVVLHTDGARTYKMRLPGVIHDKAVHCKKKTVTKGKTVWVNPKYSQIKKHILSDGQNLFVKTGTQIIDRFWSHLKGAHGQAHAQGQQHIHVET